MAEMPVSKELIRAARRADLYTFLVTQHPGDIVQDRHDRSSVRLRDNHSISIKQGYTGYTDWATGETGNSLDRAEMERLLDAFDGLVVVDEAYIDFSSGPSLLGQLKERPNLVILQTFSKAWGCAGIRLGIACAHPEVIAILNKIKYPYNVNQLTQEKAWEILDNQEAMKSQLTLILSERTRMQQELSAIPLVKKIYPTDANFILTDVGNADQVYQKLVEQGIIVRNRNKVALCAGCLRITVGTEDENTTLLNALKSI